MTDIRKHDSRSGISLRLVFLLLLSLCLLISGITFASYYSQDDTLADGRVAAFNVKVTDDGLDIESGEAGSDSWNLEFEAGDSGKERTFKVTNKSEVTVRVIVDGDPVSPYTLPNVKSDATQTSPLELDPGEDGTITLTVTPATDSQMGAAATVTQEGTFVFDIRQVD